MGQRRFRLRLRRGGRRNGREATVETWHPLSPNGAPPAHSPFGRYTQRAPPANARAVAIVTRSGERYK